MSISMNSLMSLPEQKYYLQFANLNKEELRWIYSKGSVQFKLLDDNNSQFAHMFHTKTLR